MGGAGSQSVRGELNSGARSLRPRDHLIVRRQARPCSPYSSASSTTTLIRLILRGRKIGKRMFAPGCPPVDEIAADVA